jgi:hypothetical protein
MDVPDGCESDDYMIVDADTPIIFIIKQLGENSQEFLAESGIMPVPTNAP